MQGVVTKNNTEIWNKDVIFADFHIHSCFSYATSKEMIIPTILERSKSIGLNLIGTGDILHSKWREHLKEHLKENEEGIYEPKEKQEVKFIATGEIEDKESIHHLFFLPDIEIAGELSHLFETRYKIDMNKYGGRPILPIGAEELVEIIHEYEGIVGPAHAFTPFKAIFRANKYSSLKDCYGTQAKKIDFIELGLSANSIMADQISELWQHTYITNSDSHSPNPGKMGRECNVMNLQNITYSNITNAISGVNQNKIVANIGMEPRLGKYHSSFCFKCRRRIKYVDKPKEKFNQDFLFFDTKEQEYLVENIVNKKERCPACKGILKLGVKDRVANISTTNDQNKNRPPYYNIIPIPNILAEIYKLKSSNSRRVKSTHKELVSKLGSEFQILLDIPVSEIHKHNEVLGRIIEKMRRNELNFIEGGGGIYGRLELPIKFQH